MGGQWLANNQGKQDTRSPPPHLSSEQFRGLTVSTHLSFSMNKEQLELMQDEDVPVFQAFDEPFPSSVK